jgi:uncharacterized protein (DUF1810 family)
MSLDRFIEAQRKMYPQALKEIKNGKKESHWVWYIFPQFVGIGFSYDSHYYGIKSIKEAREYYENEYLRNNLIEITEALLKMSKNQYIECFSNIDYTKICSSMTLFFVATKNELFKEAIDKYYGKLDPLTLDIIKEFGEEKSIETIEDVSIVRGIWERYL